MTQDNFFTIIAILISHFSHGGSQQIRIQLIQFFSNFHIPTHDNQPVTYPQEIDERNLFCATNAIYF